MYLNNLLLTTGYNKETHRIGGFLLYDTQVLSLLIFYGCKLSIRYKTFTDVNQFT
jgi:hypothetical protein